MPSCRCASFRDVDVDEFHAESPVRRFQTLQRRGSPMWWLSLRRCADCAQHWLVAQEERLNDLYIVARITDDTASTVRTRGDWPDALSTYEQLLRIGQANGHAARYVDPSELWPIAIDLFGQRATLDAGTLAELVHVSIDDAQALLARAQTEIGRLGYPYPWSAAG